MNTTFEAFKARAEAVSAEVHQFSGKDKALAFVLVHEFQQVTA
jgi:hypothetical protein